MYYGSAGAPRTYGPNVLWYYGGRNYLVADMDTLPSGNYAVGFGGGQTPIKLVVSSVATHLSPSPLSAQELVTGFKVRVVDARHRTKDPIESTALCQLIPMHGRQPAQLRGKSA